MHSKSILVTFTLFLSTLAFGKEDLSSYIRCYHTINDGTSGRSSDQAVSCNTKKRICYVLVLNGAKTFSIPNSPSYSKNQVKLRETDVLQDIDVYPVSWGASQTEKIEIHFYKQIGGFFVKAPEASEKPFVNVTPTAVAEQEAVEHFQKYINNNIANMRYNLDTESRPEGWTEAQYKKKSQSRISGCLNFPNNSKLKLTVDEFLVRLKRN
jgi:hypothetical protein